MGDETTGATLPLAGWHDGTFYTKSGPITTGFLGRRQIYFSAILACIGLIRSFFCRCWTVKT